MARLPRLSIAGYVHHVLQRGNNRQWVFVDDADRTAMVALLDDLVRSHAVALHAYVLLPEHFHLLATPSTDDGLPRLMQALGRRYVRYFNQRHGRSGTLWEGRYRSTVLEAGAHLLPCMVALDLHPVRTGLVAQARDYPWSSHLHYAGLGVQRLLTPPSQYWALGNTPFAREQAYAQRVQDGIGAAELQALMAAVQSGWALGGAEFLAGLQKLTPRRLMRAEPGRPPRAP
jgi:putative transposase